MRITLYHNPRCSKSRQALQLLQERGVEIDTIPYLEQPPTADQLRLLLQQLDMAPRQLLRTGEAESRELNLAQADDDAVIAAMVAHPRLIERPIAVAGARAVVGRPPERVLELL
jgi:arsenate reductase